MNETDWIQQSLKGNSGAFGRLVRAYQTPVYNLAYRMLGERMEAEDAAQETFLRAFQRLRQYDSARPFRNWILSIAANHCIDRIRRQRPTLPLDDVPLGTTYSPETAMLHSEGRDRIQRLLMELSPDDRAVITLRYWYDCSCEEIAQAMETSVSAVKSRLHRARLTLAAQLNPTMLDVPEEAIICAEPVLEAYHGM